jgi:molecular chaperone DnaJ
VTIEVPAGTQTGQQFRLLKRGVPRLGEKGRGDLRVEVRVVVPAVTGDRGRALLRELEQELQSTSGGDRRDERSEQGPGSGR